MPSAPTLRPAILGPFGPAQLACLRSWRRLGLAPRFIHVGEPVWGMHHLAEGVLSLSRQQWQTEAGAARVAAFLSEQGCQGITCLAEADARRLWAIAPRLAGSIALWLPELASMARLASKLEQMAMAEAAGFTLLPLRVATEPSPPAIPEEWFPLVARPDRPETLSPVFKVQLLKNHAELGQFLQGFSRMEGPILLQPLVEGANLLIHGATNGDGSWQVWQAFRVERKFEGVALTITPMLLSADLRRSCQEFAQRAGIVGCFHLDLIHDPIRDRIYFLEMNGRLGGTTAKVMAAGFDEPRWLLTGFGTLPHAVPPELSRRVTVANRVTMLKYGWHHWRGNTTRLDYPHPGPWTALADLLAGSVLWRDEILDWRDPLGSLLYYADLVVRHRPRR